jgi:hypothetical protein
MRSEEVTHMSLHEIAERLAAQGYPRRLAALVRLNALVDKLSWTNERLKLGEGVDLELRPGDALPRFPTPA